MATFNIPPRQKRNLGTGVYDDVFRRQVVQSIVKIFECKSERHSGNVVRGILDPTGREIGERHDLLLYPSNMAKHLFTW